MRYPIVLAHGIAPFDTIYLPFLKGLRKLWSKLGRDPDRYDYFKGIASHLRRHDFTVCAPRVDFSGSVRQRAKELAQAVRKILKETGAAKVHVIAHSMGGLDARHMIVCEDMQDSVATLTTIGTPHLGTPYADVGLELAGGLVDFLKDKLDVDLTGFKDLRTKEAAEFNRRAEKTEAENPVGYVVYASNQDEARIFGPLKPSWKIIYEKEGENDGLVSAASQSWTPELTGEGCRKKVRQEKFPIGADHLNQLGWWDLDQLRGTRWWRRSLWREIRDFEDSVKAAYLKMAQDAWRPAEQ